MEKELELLDKLIEETLDGVLTWRDEGVYIRQNDDIVIVRYSGEKGSWWNRTRFKFEIHNYQMTSTVFVLTAGRDKKLINRLFTFFQLSEGGATPYFALQEAIVQSLLERKDELIEEYINN